MSELYDKYLAFRATIKFPERHVTDLSKAEKNKHEPVKKRVGYRKGEMVKRAKP